MCGIAGFIDHRTGKQDAERILGSMLERITHRGPDARGSWHEEKTALGHNRLSIIDLSEEANQPMFREHLVIVYNGEIYNYIEIRDKLIKKGHRFFTQSDTEVILAAYLEWGAGCVNEFVGMWAFAIWDKNKKSLFASRDRFGIKPFYYITEGERFYFGSEFKALKVSPLFSGEPNISQVYRGLQLGWTCCHDETYFERIKALPAAHNLFYLDGHVSVSRYWDIHTGRFLNTSFEEKRQRFLELFSDSISLHMRSDVKVGSCLSGGLDSSAIVSMVQTQQPDLKYKSFSIYYEGEDDVDERPFIKEVINRYPNVEPYYYSPASNEIKESFHHALYHADVPCTGSSFISQYFLMKLIGAQKIKVVLDGQGADEYLGGYMHSFYRIVADEILAGHPARAFSLTHRLNRMHNAGVIKTMAHFGKSALSLMKDEQELYDLEFRKYHPFMGCYKIPAPFRLDKVDGSKTDNFLYHLMFTTSLPTLLQYEDRNSMAFSIESRVPFLDHRLVEFAFQLRNEDKINGTLTKYILRKALSGILPRAVEERKDKKGFVTPGEQKWLRGPLSHLLKDDFKVPDFLKKKIVLQLIKEYKGGDNSKSQVIWRLSVLNYWMKHFMN